MQSIPMNKSPNNQNYFLTSEHQAYFYHLLNGLNNEQLRSILINFLPNSPISNQFRLFTRNELLQQCFLVINNYYSTELEQTLYLLRQANLAVAFNDQHPYYCAQPSTNQYNLQPTMTQTLRPIRPNLSPSQSTNGVNPQSQRRVSINNIPIPQQIIKHNAPTSVTNSSASSFEQYQTSLGPQSTPSSSQINKSVHKHLPFYHPIKCIFERFDIFQYDTYRKQNVSRIDFILPFDVCNQLSLSYDYDPNANVYKTSKRLILRLIRIDQPATFYGKYDDNLPPNLAIYINGRTITNLPTPKACTRQQSDLIRIGREIDVTSYCMFNPMLKNEITITWSYRPDNTVLHSQYSNAKYASHIFLVESLTINDLYEQILNKRQKFLREDLFKLIAKGYLNDNDPDLEVSNQKLKLTCPIDQRRLKTPVRAATCQHLQCFDLRNYIALNEKSSKWICPVCNRIALFEDLQIDSYTESILNSIKDENINEITINSDLNWTPVYQSNIDEEMPETKPDIKTISTLTFPSTGNDVILIDDD